MNAAEYIARALCADSGNDPDELVKHPASKSWESPDMPHWERYQHDAEVALKAMAEWMIRDIAADDDL